MLHGLTPLSVEVELVLCVYYCTLEPLVCISKYISNQGQDSQSESQFI